MSCLLPQFKCNPDSFASSFKCQSHSSSRSRDVISFRTQCILSTSSPSTTAILEFDKQQSPSLEAAVLDLETLPSLSTHSIRTDSWRYSGVTRTTSELNLGSDIEKDTLLMSDEAVINAAASQAVTLAKAAFELAKDAAVTGNPKKSTDHDSASSLIFNDVDDSIFMKSQELTTKASELESCEYSSTPQSESEDREPTSDEHELLKAQLCTSITVRSTRQIERKTKRNRAAEKAYANIVSVKSCSSTRKKRSNTRDMDYSDPLCYLRGVTSSCRLLTASEERVFSQGIQAMLKLERLHEELKERLGGDPTLAQWAAAARVDQKTLMKQINHGISCKDKMIKSNIRLVFSIAKNYQGAGMNLHDLVQEGCRGLVRGLEKFDASKGFKFSTYAHWWIKQAVRKSLSDQSRTIRLPLHMVYATYRVKEARNQFFSENGRFPDDEEVSEATGLSMKRLSTVLLTPKSPRSLDQKIGANLDLKPSDIIADPEAETSEDLLMKQFMKRELLKVLDTLNPREKQIVKLRFGLEGGRRKTLQEIGELMGVSRERIRQIESCAFRKLKNKKRIKTLQQYVMT